MKRGVSPVVATVLLIAITIVLAAIVFFWARTFLAEGAQKQGRAVELACDRLDFEASLTAVGDSMQLDVLNRGNVPLYGLVLKLLDRGSVIPHEVSLSVNVGESVSIPLDSATYGEVNEVLVVPVLLAEQGDDGNRVTYPCPDTAGQLIHG